MRKRITYANVVATLALVFAMSGGALAANHYLINSTRQISPKVLKKLKGSAGKRGAPGLTGAPGKEGAQGKGGPQGKEGPQGTEGKPGVVPASLPSGTSESGNWAVAAGDSTTGFMDEGIAFPEPLAAPLDGGHVAYEKPAATSTNCPGIGKAAAGFLCVYATQEANASVQDIDEGNGLGGADSSGFMIFMNSTASLAHAYGRWTVTAP